MTSQALSENRPLKVKRWVGYLFRLDLELTMTFLLIESRIQIMHGLYGQMVFKIITRGCLELKYLWRAKLWQVKWLLLQSVTVETQSRRATGMWVGHF